MSTPSFDDFNHLVPYAHDLHNDWLTYSRMFVPENCRKTLNRRGSSVMRRFQLAMQDRILLAIARLFDETKGPGRTKQDTLSLRQTILAAIPEPQTGTPPKERKETVRRRHSLLTECQLLEKDCANIINHRHQRLAHNDKRVLRDHLFLPGVARQDVDGIVQRIMRLIERLSLALNNGRLGFLRWENRIEPQCDLLIDLMSKGNDVLDEQPVRRRKSGVLG